MNEVKELLSKGANANHHSLEKGFLKVHVNSMRNHTLATPTVLGRHGSDSLCRDERENKMAATYMY